MARSPGKAKKPTRSRVSRSTRRSSASTLTSKNEPRKDTHRKLANELYSRSLAPKAAKAVQEAIVEGVSMWPLLRAGYRVTFRKIDPEALDCGDIVVLRSYGRAGEELWRVHRLVGRVGPLFLEAGDNSYSAALVKPEDILGRVESVRDWKGKKVEVARSGHAPRRFRYFLWCANTFMFAHELKDRVVGRRKSRALWMASRVYRAGLGAVGLSVPAIPPK